MSERSRKLPCLGSFYRGTVLNERRKAALATFYRPEMCPTDIEGGFSRSPLKPRLLIEHLGKRGLGKFFPIMGDWPPFEEDEFLVAHEERYVRDFFAGREPAASSSFFRWSREFADSVRYTNASLHAAILHSVTTQELALSPTSGFHHATPAGGDGFCAMSGQVIASAKLYRTYGWRGVYVDLDAHFGNSIPDSMTFTPDLGEAVIANINPSGQNPVDYLRNLRLLLVALDHRIQDVSYVVLCHGADSHEWDDTRGDLPTEVWLEAANSVYDFVRHYRLPLCLSLFGGYREDDFNSVLELHTASLTLALDRLTGTRICCRPIVRPRGGETARGCG